MTPTPYPPGIIESIHRLFKDSAGFTLPEMYFSDDEPETVTYGDLDESEVKERIRELENEYERRLIERNRRREEDWRPEHRDDDWRRDRDRREENWRREHDCREEDWGRDRDRREEDWCPEHRDNGRYPRDDVRNDVPRDESAERRDFKKEIDKARARQRTTIVVAGMYYPDVRRIVIFNKAFTQSDPEEREAAIRMTIAHETFHALHHYLAPATFTEGTYYAEIVSEALADFYAYMYCLDGISAGLDGVRPDLSEKQSRERYKFWMNNLYGSIPYPNAAFCTYRDECFFPDDFDDCMHNGPIDKFRTVLKLSETNMRRAYLELVPDEFRKKPPKKMVNGVQTPYKNDGQIIVVAVRLGARDYTYRLDPDEPDIAVGDTVTCHNKNGRKTEGIVVDVKYMDEAQYWDLCDRIGYPELSVVTKV